MGQQRTKSLLALVLRNEKFCIYKQCVSTFGTTGQLGQRISGELGIEIPSPEEVALLLIASSNYPTAPRFLQLSLEALFRVHRI